MKENIETLLEALQCKKVIEGTKEILQASPATLARWKNSGKLKIHCLRYKKLTLLFYFELVNVSNFNEEYKNTLREKKRKTYPDYLSVVQVAEILDVTPAMIYKILRTDEQANEILQPLKLGIKSDIRISILNLKKFVELYTEIY